jgi:hypothetical protein
MFCLPKFAADILRSKFSSGELTPSKLSEMTSAERREAFSFLGAENAKKVNTAFEQKLLLKNQEQAMINWAKEVLGEKSPALRDTLTKIEKNAELLTPDEMDMFLEDLVEKKLGVNVTPQEAATLVELAGDVATKKAAIPENAPNGSPVVLEYGTSLALFKKYMEDLKLENVSPFVERMKNDKAGLIKDALGATKSMTATGDLSFIGIQGAKMLLTNPVKTIGIIKEVLKGIPASLRNEDAVLPTKAWVYSRKNARNGLDAKAKLATGIGNEEVYPTAIPSRIPGIGRLFSASDHAFQNFALRSRAVMFDLYIEKAKKAGLDITDAETLEGIGSLANVLSGRAGLGKWEAVGNTINVAFFSPRFALSNIHFLTSHLMDPKATPFVKKVAAQNLLKVVASVATVLATANALGFETEEDPTSTNFGKIKVGDSWVDISGKMGSFVVLATRLITGDMRTQKGKYIDLDSGKFGALSRASALGQFAEGKLSPPFGAALDYLQGKDFDGNKPTLLSTLKRLTMPMSLDSTMKTFENSKDADLLLLLILTGLNTVGFNTSTPK